MKLLKWVIILLCCVSANGQTHGDVIGTLAVGTGAGTKLYYGAWGVFGQHRLGLLNNKVSAEMGFGIRHDIVLGLGLNYQLSNYKNKVFNFVNVAYSYQKSGTVNYETSSSTDDIYSIGNTQFVHYYASSRLHLNRYAALRFNIGYGQKISGGSVVHQFGPNLNYNRIKSTLNSGILYGLDFMVFLK